MPIQIATELIPAVTVVRRRSVSAIQLRFRPDGSNSVDMITHFVIERVVDGVVADSVPDGSVVHPFEEICQWPEFAPAYQRIKSEVYARREAQDLAVVAVAAS